VTIPNVEHLLEQADRLIAPSGRGAPRQVDLRRAISNAYYALFHAVSIAGADQFVGRARQSEQQYALVYRSVEHRALRQLCEDLGKTTLPAKYEPYIPRQGLGVGIGAFALAVVDLQAKRHSADYDPMIRLTAPDAQMAIRTARRALALFNIARRSRMVFLMLLLFPPR
jgi:hypothetical protein